MAQGKRGKSRNRKGNVSKKGEQKGLKEREGGGEKTKKEKTERRKRRLQITVAKNAFGVCREK